MWTETHKRKDGSYVTEAAREIGVSILLIYDYLSSYLIKFLIMVTYQKTTASIIVSNY